MHKLFFLAALLLGSLTASAQIDAKLNGGSAITGGLGVAADFTVGPQSSVSAGLGYARTKVDVDVDNENQEFNYARFRIIPEYRYYFNPRTVADRFFLGGYGKIVLINAEATSGDDSVDYSATRGVLGVMLGSKWVYDSGVVFEVNGGIGGGVILGDSVDGSAVATALNALAGVDFRLGIIVGYRF